MELNRFVAIVPGQGSGYYLELGGGLIQVPILADGTVVVPTPGAFKGYEEAEVDWGGAFDSDAHAEPVRAIERALEAIPDDLSESIAPHRFNLSIRLGADEMHTADHVVGALRQAADAIETGGELKGKVCIGSGGAEVGHYSGCLPGDGQGRGMPR